MPGELFSSWLVRTALAQGCDPLVLTGHLWPKWRIWTIDLDRGLPPDRLAELAAVSRIEAADLDAASFRDFGVGFNRDATNVAVWPWLLALGSRNRRRYSGLQYCPRCIAEDATPYFRRIWRMAWHTVCDVHDEGLHDRCSVCHAALEPHRLTAYDGRIDRCATCRADLKNAPSLPVNPGALAFQRLADGVLRDRTGYFGGSPLNVSDWFSLTHFFVALIRRVVTMQPLGLKQLLAQLGAQPEDIPLPANSRLALELMPVATRAAIFSSLPNLMAAGQVSTLTAARAARLTAASFSGVREAIPDALRSVISALPTGYRVGRRPARKSKFNPRSPAAVLRRCARMQRRFARL